MIRVADHIDEIIEKCFSDPELVELLEFDIGGTKVSIKDQFLHYYETACYMWNKPSLIRDIMMKINQHHDLILKLRDYKKNLSRILELGEYSKVKLSYRSELGSETTIGVAGSNTKSDNSQVDNYSGIDQSQNFNIADNRTAASQTNRVESLDTIIPQPRIEATDTPISVKKFQLENAEPTETIENYNKYKLTTPQIVEGDDPDFKVGFQNLTKDVTTNQTTDTNLSSSSRGGKSHGESESKSTHTNVKGNKSDAHDTTTEFITNEARIKLWTRELPRLKMKFWNCFFHLFLYEQV